LTEGSPEPLGVALSGDGINVAVHAPDAERVELCLFDAGTERRVPLAARTGEVWHGHVARVAAGQRYGLRAHGEWRPAAGLRFNGAKLLVDPYATALDRHFALAPSMFGHHGQDDSGRDDIDSAPDMPLCIVERPPGPSDVARPGTSWARTVIYELHVRGFTMLHPGIPPELRGTFTALAHPAALTHLVELGVTAVEILPPAAWIDERHLPPLGLSNYWGYNTAAFLVPDPRLAPGGWAEVRAAVAALAAAGIETVVDVVLNHSGEGDELGPTLSLRGLDNAGYYRLRDGGRWYANDTGCGNTLALHRPPGLRLAMEALRTWARHGGVHGFRFDLGPVLGRRDDGFDAHGPLLQAISQDPVLRELKLISEPWDVGPGGYQLGRFPGGWGEWNDQFRDGTRKFWRGDPGTRGAMATRLAGSADLLGAHRRPSRSVNFFVAHDGFTAADLVSYDRKHNHANGEDGNDGRDDNASWNNGVEGATDDAAVLAARIADQVALQATLLLSRGTPMLLMGSEGGQTQRGNNNAYCQDNALAWLDWSAMDSSLLAATRAAIAMRLAHPALHEDRFLTGDGDVSWLNPDGTPDDWRDGDTLVAELTTGPDRVLLVLHRGRAAITVTAPPGLWHLAFGVAAIAGSLVAVPPRNVVVLTSAAAPG